MGSAQRALPIYDQPPRQVADTSLEAWDRIKWTLSEREIEVFLALHRYLEATGYQDATAAELALWAGVDKTWYRPRYTGLRRKGWIDWAPARQSRDPDEGRAHPARPVLSRESVKRATRSK